MLPTAAAGQEIELEVVEDLLDPNNGEAARTDPNRDGEGAGYGSGVTGCAGRGAHWPTMRFLQMLIKNWSGRWARTSWTPMMVRTLVLSLMGMVKGLGMVLGPRGVQQEV